MSYDTRILNKEICLGLYFGVLLMSWWFDDWHCFSSVPSVLRDRSCIFSFTHPSAGWRGHARGGCTCGETHFAPALGCYFTGSDSFLMIFHFPYFLYTVDPVCLSYQLILSSLIGWRGARATGRSWTPSRSHSEHLFDHKNGIRHHPRGHQHNSSTSLG